MKKYVLVGTGHRAIKAYIEPLTQHFTDCVKFCGLYDINIKRAAVASKMAAYPIDIYDDFDKMLEKVQPDTVIVTTIDAEHSEYIIKSLNFGCDVVSEKPLTTDDKQMKAIYEAEKKAGKKVQVTFNCRFMPVFMRVKELLQSGIIGEMYSAHYEWLLDTSHGADYFRRWHAERAKSGSLLIHKCTHHFDLLNWFLDDEPEKVNAFGTRRFYGPTRENRGERCKDCKVSDKCEFYTDISKTELYKNIYLGCEEDDGYHRDKCVFSDRIDIEDTVSVNIKYKKGAIASYSLTAHSPYEGMRLCINGSLGRIEISTFADGKMYGGNKTAIINVFNRMGEKIDIAPNKSETMIKLPRFGRVLGGGHGGADMLLCDMIFRNADEDPLTLLADSRAGAMSIGIGIAANKSMLEDRAVYLNEFYDYL